MIKLPVRTNKYAKKILLHCEYCGSWWLISERELDIVEDKGLFPKCDCEHGHSKDLMFVSEMTK